MIPFKYISLIQDPLGGKASRKSNFYKKKDETKRKKNKIKEGFWKFPSTDVL